MPFEQHQEKDYPKDAQHTFEAALKATEKLGGTLLVSDAAELRLEAKFPKVILGKTLGERTQLFCEVHAAGEGSHILVDAFPLDVLDCKLIFGVRKGVTQTVVTWFVAHLENNLGVPAPSE